MRFVVLQIPGLSAGSLGCYGNEWIQTPHLDRIASRGISFDQHFGDSSPEKVDLTSRRLDGRWIQALIDQNAITTCAGLMELDAASQIERPVLWIEVLSLFEGIVEAFGLVERRSIACEDDEAAEEAKAEYAKLVSDVDAEIGRFLVEWSGNTVLVTSPFGFACGEHGAIGWDGSLYEELVHLPLLIQLPNNEQAGRRISSFTQPDDVCATLHDWLRLPRGVGAGGLSLAPLMEGKREAARWHAVTKGSRGRSAIRTRDWTFLEGEPPLLFRRPEDKWEVNDIAMREPGAIEDLRSILQKHDGSADLGV